MITLYNAISSDGFIARIDGNEDFIPDEVWNDFLEICNAYDVIVMGSRSYTAMQKYELEEIRTFEQLHIKKVVISRDTNFKVKEGYVLLHSTDEVKNFGKNILLCSGPALNTVFLNEKRIDKIIHNKVFIEIH